MNEPGYFTACFLIALGFSAVMWDDKKSSILISLGAFIVMFLLWPIVIGAMTGIEIKKLIEEEEKLK